MLAENACFCSARKWHFHLQDFELTFLVLFFFFKKSLAALCVHMCGACWDQRTENYVGYLLLSLSVFWGGTGTVTELGALGQ